MQVQTPIAVTDERELLLDLSLYVSIISMPSKSREELKESLFEEFKLNKPFPTLENRRYELSKLVAPKFKIMYNENIMLEESEDIITLEDKGVSESVSFEDLDPLVLRNSTKRSKTMESVIDLKQEIKLKYDIEDTVDSVSTDDMINNIGSIKNISSNIISDEGLEDLKSSSVDYYNGQVPSLSKLLGREIIEEVSEEESNLENSFTEETYVVEESTPIQDEFVYSPGEEQIISGIDVEEDDWGDDWGEDEEYEDIILDDDEEDEEYEDVIEDEDEDDDWKEDYTEEIEEVIGVQIDTDSGGTDPSFVVLEDKNSTSSNFVDVLGDDNNDLESIDITNDVNIINQVPVEDLKYKPIINRNIGSGSVSSSNEGKLEFQGDIRKFVRCHPHCEISLALEYFTKNEIDRALMTGKIVKKGNTLR